MHIGDELAYVYAASDEPFVTQGTASSVQFVIFAVSNLFERGRYSSITLYVPQLKTRQFAYGMHTMAGISRP